MSIKVMQVSTTPKMNYPKTNVCTVHVYRIIMGHKYMQIDRPCMYIIGRYFGGMRFK